MGCGCSRALNDVDSSVHAASVIITAAHSPHAAAGQSPPASPRHVTSGKPPLSPQQVLLAAQQCIAEEPQFQSAGLASVTLAALALIQSGGRTDAKNYREDLGDVCHGLGQLTLSTARCLAQEGGAQRYGRNPSVALLEQPGPALYYTAAYLCWLSAEAGHIGSTEDNRHHHRRQQQQQQQQHHQQPAPQADAQQGPAAAAELAVAADQACQAHVSCSSSLAHSRSSSSSSSSSCGGRGGGGVRASLLSSEALEEWRVKAYLQGPKGVSHAAAALFWLKFTKARAALQQLQAAVTALQAKQQQRLEQAQRRRQRRALSVLQQHNERGAATGVNGTAGAGGSPSAAGVLPSAAPGSGVAYVEGSDSSGGSGFCTMHVLQPGEDLVQVAAVCGSSVEAILAANPEIGGLEDLQPHDCIALPVPLVLPRLYVLQPGDTLRSVAKAHSTTVGRLVSKNPELLDAGRVQPGWVVSIPGLKGDSRSALDLSDSIEAAARVEREARELAASARARSPVSSSHWGWHNHTSGSLQDNQDTGRSDQDSARTLSWGWAPPAPLLGHGAAGAGDRGASGTAGTVLSGKADQRQGMPQAGQQYKGRCQAVGGGALQLQPDTSPHPDIAHHHHQHHRHLHHRTTPENEEQQQQQQQDMLQDAHSPPVSAVVTSLATGVGRGVTAV